MSTDAPAKPKGMSDEHKRRMAEGRARSRAAKNAATATPTAAPPSPAPETVSFAAEVERLKAALAAKDAENARIRKEHGILTADEVAALPTRRCYYEFVADKVKEPHGEPLGEVLHDVDSPRWDELTKIRHAVMGQVIVQRIVRAKSGEVLRYEDEACINAKSPQAALANMRAYAANPAAWY